jgi:hypothetical protein
MSDSRVAWRIVLLVVAACALYMAVDPDKRQPDNESRVFSGIVALGIAGFLVFTRQTPTEEKKEASSPLTPAAGFRYAAPEFGILLANEQYRASVIQWIKEQYPAATFRRTAFGEDVATFASSVFPTGPRLQFVMDHLHCRFELLIPLMKQIQLASPATPALIKVDDLTFLHTVFQPIHGGNLSDTIRTVVTTVAYN